MSLASYLRPAWRSLRRSPAFTITASLTLLIGLAASIAIFALVNGVLLRPLPYGDSERLVGAWHDMPGVDIRKGNQTAATYFTYKKLARTLEGIGVYQQSAVNVSDPRGGTEPQRITSASVTESVLPVLQVSPLLGRNFTEAEDLPNGPTPVLIGEGMWRSRFGADREILGRTLEVNGRAREIIGVMPQSFRFPTAATQVWLPLKLDPNDPNPGGFNYDAIARLKRGITVAEANRDLRSVLPRIVELSPNMAPGVPTQMLLDQARPVPYLIPLREDVTSGFATTLWIVAGAAALVLLVACANVTNLILVRADARQRELAVREAIGAGRARVMAHFLSESAVITAVAGAVALGVATLALRALVRAGPAGIPRLAEVSVDFPTIAFAIVISGVVAVICSVIPALRLGRASLSKALREGGRGGTAGRVQQRVRGTLVAAQIALALVALAGSGLLVRTFQQLNGVRPGFDPEGLATFWMSLPQARYQNDTAAVRFYTLLLDRVREVPGVSDVAISSRLPLMPNGMNLNPLYPESDPSYATKIPPLQIFTTIDGGYFKTMGIPLIAGRTFQRLDVQRFDEAIISQATAVQFWKDSTGQKAIGQRFRDLPGGRWSTIIGVVGNARDTALAAPPSQTVYFPQVPSNDQFNNQTRYTMALVIRTPLAHSAISRTVQNLVRELDPTLPLFDVRPMRAVFNSSMAQLSFTILILGVAAGVTLLLGAIGLYGVMAYVIALRTRELGVRIALGASPRSVIGMLTSQGVVLTGIGIVAGLALFMVVARFLRTMLYGVAPTDPLTLALASLLLVGVAALASWIPARRTSRLDPAEVLRAE
ncbi:MAG TPA: ABC transporter permease [Gemmatimonadaceae bacterium]|nr:ABC transporter permease [Gemmatimonadaceae bacterium]